MRRVAAVVVVAMLAGCAARPVAPPTFVAADASRLTTWAASGRLAVAANGEGGSGSFAWEQREASSTLELRGPLGAGAMGVTFDGAALSVVDSDGRRLDDSETRSLLRERLGAEFPWTELRYWMLGVPAPDGAASVVDAGQAPLRVIEQAGWRVAYDGFRPVAGVSLPVRFTAVQGAVRLKVTVDEWRVAGAAGQGP